MELVLNSKEETTWEAKAGTGLYNKWILGKQGLCETVQSREMVEILGRTEAGIS
jgi:hypothetical protein